ncbi:MAG: phosphotransferase family protein [Acidobacteria bacterium]|nr:MAG: phosphotransferase family protein [Acidobacteriota bacterium]
MGVDAPGPARAGEELDEGRLAQYLRRTLALEGPVRVEQFPGGHSNLTYLVTVGARELVLRRPPFGSTVKTAHDMGREFRVLSAIGPRFRKVPAVVAFCDDPSILGASFYLMQRVRGVILRSRVPEGVSLTPDTVSRLCAAIADTLVELHGIDYEAAGLADLGRPEGYAQRQVTGWTRRYQDAQTDAVADMDDVARWLAGHVPASGEASLLHNDYKHDNLVLDPGDPSRILAVLDWEMSTPGDPLMDLGTTLAYWVEEGDGDELKAAAFGPTRLPGSDTRRQLAARYAERSGRAVHDLDFYYCFGLFKIAVIVQQIHYRFRQGLTRDPRFAGLGRAVAVLARQAALHLGRPEL